MNTKQTGTIITAALIVQLLTSLGAGVSGEKERQPSRELVTAFELRDINGRHFAWSPDDSVDSKPLMLWFTNLCAGCQSAIPMLESLYRDSLRQNVELVAVSLLGSDKKTVRDVVNRFDISFRILLDPDGDVTASYTGSYMEGTCPMENLILIEPNGGVGFRGHFPGMHGEEILGLIKANNGSPTTDGE